MNSSASTSSMDYCEPSDLASAHMTEMSLEEQIAENTLLRQQNRSLLAANAMLGTDHAVALSFMRRHQHVLQQLNKMRISMYELRQKNSILKTQLWYARMQTDKANAKNELLKDVILVHGNDAAMQSMADIYTPMPSYDCDHTNAPTDHTNAPTDHKQVQWLDQVHLPVDAHQACIRGDEYQKNYAHYSAICSEFADIVDFADVAGQDCDIHMDKSLAPITYPTRNTKPTARVIHEKLAWKCRQVPPHARKMPKIRRRERSKNSGRKQSTW